jgi:5-(carboxyamino)imidazole ribonucleotide mutase
MIAAKTLLPVIGVPVDSTALNGLDALLSIVQMPKGTPVATMAIGKAGAANAALFAVEILAQGRPELLERLREWKATRRKEAAAQQTP